jgi:hypothetical protein
MDVHVNNERKRIVGLLFGGVTGSCPKQLGAHSIVWAE